MQQAKENPIFSRVRRRQPTPTGMPIYAHWIVACKRPTFCFEALTRSYVPLSATSTANAAMGKKAEARMPSPSTASSSNRITSSACENAVAVSLLQEIGSS